uniref:Uncharacterized protein n=1 Tax=Erpetoichthys calabaricus TaxID=27687 RepID=A0A8C4RU68_ERPCA
ECLYCMSLMYFQLYNILFVFQILKDHILLKVKVIICFTYSKLIIEGFSFDALKSKFPSESCCFLRHTLRFYVEKVFSHYTASNSQIRRRASGLANSFLTIKRDLRQCVSRTCSTTSLEWINKNEEF